MIDKIIGLINPAGKDLNNLSRDEFLELLIRLNQSLRGFDESKDVLEEHMIAGDLVSPTKEVQMKILEYLVQNMSKVQNKKAKAAMVYYTLINLHMFSDGNGRTSRFMYDLISGELSENNISYYFHRDSNNTKKQDNDLEKSKGIMDISLVNQIPDELIAGQLSFVPEELLENYDWITVGRTDASPTTESILPASAIEDLSQKELHDLDKILLDGCSMQLCPSGLAILYVSNKKGQLGQWIEMNTASNKASTIRGIEGRFNFSIYKNPHMIAEWTPNDFREVISVGNAVKYARLKCLIDIFIEPEKYINVDSGNTYLDDILSTSKTKEKDKRNNCDISI